MISLTKKEQLLIFFVVLLLLLGFGVKQWRAEKALQPVLEFQDTRN